MDLGLRHRTAAVAAASTGLGFAVARELAIEGARVFLCSRSSERVEKAVALIRREVSRASGIEPQVFGGAADLASGEGPAAFIDAARARLGRVEILVVNNGGPPPGVASAVNDDEWEAGYRLTFRSAERLVAQALPEMRAAQWGRIVFVTSVSVKQPLAELAVSSAMRSAVVGYAKCLSDEVARDGVTVNCVAPGSTATERLEELLRKRAERRNKSADAVKAEALESIPMRRFGRSDEFAAVVAFLASERASYVTGTVLCVDGGLSRSLT